VSDLHPILWRVLKNLDDFGVLSDAEVVCEQEFAALGSDPGGLFVTDRRLLFVTTTLLGRKKDVHSVPLEDISATSTSTGRFPKKDNGVLRVDSNGCQVELVFERIPGGEERAAEIAQTIVRQKKFL
jgi:PH (Pleckstrin Homology) domain-containing protein